MNSRDAQTLLSAHRNLEDEFPDNYDCEVAQEKREAALQRGQERDARIEAMHKNYPTPEQIEAEDRERHRLHEARWDLVRISK